MELDELIGRFIIETNGITTELVDFITTNCLFLLKVSEPSEDAPEEEKQKYIFNKKLIMLYSTMVCREILIKTNRKKFPQELRYTVINMVMDKFDINKQTEEMQSIQSMSEAGRTISFGIPDLIVSKFSLLVQKQLNDYETFINRYRLVYKL